MGACHIAEVDELSIDPIEEINELSIEPFNVGVHHGGRELICYGRAVSRALHPRENSSLGELVDFIIASQSAGAFGDKEILGSINGGNENVVIPYLVNWFYPLK
ncbi:hypothetical protein KSP39_PZI011274 [Platanthera zijinensis]|uniref:Uncharacterized protein n=1 Tax=Platanthera zijinensis TaxID=2320716 RepID=A0AAP0BGF4_9ASPA